MTPRNINPVFFWPQKAGAKWGQKVNLGLALNSPTVIVGSSESVKDPAALKLEGATQRSAGLSGQLSNEEKVSGACVPALVPAYRSSPAPH